MKTIIEIDTDLVEYVTEQTGFDPDDAETLISEILSMATIKPGNEPARQKMFFTTVRSMNRFIAYAKPEPFVTDPAGPDFPTREPGPLYFDIANTREAALEKLAAGLISGGGEADRQLYLTQELWFCPACNISTSNWRKCPRCKQPAIRKTFYLVPVEDHKKS